MDKNKKCKLSLSAKWRCIIFGCIILIIAALEIGFRWWPSVKEEDTNSISLNLTETCMINYLKNINNSGKNHSGNNNTSLINLRADSGNVREENCFCEDTEANVSFNEALRGINDLITKCPSCTNMELTLDNIKIPFRILTHNWLSSLALPIRITKLTLLNFEQRVFITLPSVFEGHPFEDLKSLTLDPWNIRGFDKTYFLKMDILRLAITCRNFVKYAFEDAFDDLLNSVESLTLKRCFNDVSLLLNITSGKGDTPKEKWLNLIYLDLSESELKFLPDESFTRMPLLETLVLDSCKIKMLADQTFSQLRLKKLSLIANDLQTLPNNIFDFFKPKGLLYVYQNTFNCSSEFEWFQEYYNVPNSPIAKEEDIFCRDGTSIKEHNFLKGYIDTFLDMKCYIPPSIQPSTEEQIGRNLAFKVEQIETSAKYEVVLKEINWDQQLVVMSLDKKVHECCYNLSKTFLLNNFTRGGVYFICLLENKRSYVNYCQTIEVPLSYQQRTWLSNRVKIPLISVVTTSFFVLAVISCTTTFFIVKKHPKLLKGNKDLIVLERRRDTSSTTVTNTSLCEAPIPEIRPLDNCYIQPSSSYNFNDGYLKPLSGVDALYTQVCSGERPKEEKYTKIKTIDEFLSAKDTAVDERDVLYFRKEYLYESLNIPPPLPPNHPVLSGFKKHSYA